MQIKDGSGKGYLTKVDSNQRLHVDSVTFGRSELEVELGNGYNINTGVVNLTSANKSAVMYFKNLEDEPIVLTGFFYLLGDTNATSGEYTITVLRNPTAGTIVTNAVDSEMAGVNRNFGSSKTLNANVYKGAEGNTFTDGDKVIESLFGVNAARHVLTVGDVVIPKGSSLGIDITPPTGNTSVNVEVSFSCFLDTFAAEN